MKRLGMLLVLALLAMGVHQGKAAASTVTLIDQKAIADNSDVYGGPIAFTLGAASNLTFSISSISGPAFSFAAAICSVAAPCSYVPLSSTLGGAGNDVTSGSFLASLSAGNYYLNILYTGVSASLSKIHFTLTADTAAAPIPPALLMFVTALGGLGFVGYRRRGLSL